MKRVLLLAWLLGTAVQAQTANPWAGATPVPHHAVPDDVATVLNATASDPVAAGIRVRGYFTASFAGQAYVEVLGTGSNSSTLVMLWQMGDKPRQLGHTVLNSVRGQPRRMTEADYQALGLRGLPVAVQNWFVGEEDSGVFVTRDADGHYIRGR